MTEEEARAWISDTLEVSRETWSRLSTLVELLIDENARQNLVAPASIAHIWARHIANSAQLTHHGSAEGLWVDVGTGAGLPGLVVAILRPTPMLLVEPRRKRAEFLVDASRKIGLTNVDVAQRDIRKVDVAASVISARAVAGLPLLFDMTIHLARNKTRWVLPKGRSADEELESVRGTWHGVFHVEQSVTAPDAKIVVASKIARKH